MNYARFKVYTWSIIFQWTCNKIKSKEDSNHILMSCSTLPTSFSWKACQYQPQVYSEWGKINLIWCHDCSPEARAGNQEPCLHSLFVMTRVLQLPSTNPLIWQTSLLGKFIISFFRDMDIISQETKLLLISIFLANADFLLSLPVPQIPFEFLPA